MLSTQLSFGAVRRLTLVVALALMAGLPTGVYAQADGTEDAPVADSVDSAAVADSVDPAAVADSVDAAVAALPTLQCRVIALRVMAPEMGGARFVCHVDGAQPGDTTFTAQAAAASQPGGRIAACTGTLVAGVGDCVGGFVDRASSTLGQFSVIATLAPSGTTLGPVALAPATAGPPAQPRPLLSPAPTAPINYFPLPEP